MKTIIFLSLFFCSVILAQQNPAEIDKYRVHLDKQIEQEEVQYFAAVLNRVLRGTGPSRRLVDFHYYEDNDVEYDMQGEVVLLKASVSYNIAASAEFTITYVFSEKGNLIYYHYKEIGYRCYEKEMYFHNEKLIKVKQRPIEENCLGALDEHKTAYEKTSGFSKEDVSEASDALKKAEKYKESFNYLFEINTME